MPSKASTLARRLMTSGTRRQLQTFLHAGAAEAAEAAQAEEAAEASSWRSKLFTREDGGHVHKCLGAAWVLHFALLRPLDLLGRAAGRQRPWSAASSAPTR